MGVGTGVCVGAAVGAGAAVGVGVGVETGAGVGVCAGVGARATGEDAPAGVSSPPPTPQAATSASATAAMIMTASGGVFLRTAMTMAFMRPLYIMIAPRFYGTARPASSPVQRSASTATLPFTKTNGMPAGN